MNVPWGILHRMFVRIFDPLKKMAAITKNRTLGSDSSFSYISPKLLGLAKFRLGKGVQLDKICGQIFILIH